MPNLKRYMRKRGMRRYRWHMAIVAVALVVAVIAFVRRPKPPVNVDDIRIPVFRVSSI